MNQMVYTPLQRMNGFDRQLGRIFEDRLLPRNRTTTSPNADWAPQVDIRELEGEFQVFVDVPGVDAKKIDVTLDKNLLTIRGERTDNVTAEDKSYKRLERFQGKFARQFSLPDSADGERISARATNGVLQITIPKVVEETPRTIQVSGE